MLGFVDRTNQERAMETRYPLGTWYTGEQGEQGNRGTGKQGNGGTGEQGNRGRGEEGKRENEPVTRYEENRRRNG